MSRLRWAILALAAMAPLTTVLPAAAEGPDRINPQGQTLDQRQPGGRFEAGPCPGETEIVNSQGACTPCLPDSIAGRGNTVCVCSPGFVETARDAWGRATCMAAGDVPAPATGGQVVSVTVPAGEFFGYARQLGFGDEVVRWAGGPIAVCGANRQGDAIYAEYSPGPSLSDLAPPTIVDDPGEISCDLVLMGLQLANGWELVRLQSIDDSECRGTNRGFTLTRRSGDPADTTHDLRLTTPGGFCIIRIREALLRGPGTGNWKDAFAQ